MHAPPRAYYCMTLRNSMSKTTGKTGWTQEAPGIESDEFRMFVFKIKECSRVRSHDWIQCPYAHPGEKVRRRDPIRQPYAAVFCPDYPVGGGRCPRGDACGLAHGVFEYWLHPARYRTRACMAGGSCPRKVCFFAHSPEQLRSGEAERQPPVPEYKSEALPVREFRSEQVMKMGDEEDLDGDSPDISWVLELLG